MSPFHHYIYFLFLIFFVPFLGKVEVDFIVEEFNLITWYNYQPLNFEKTIASHEIKFKLT